MPPKEGAYSNRTVLPCVCPCVCVSVRPFTFRVRAVTLSCMHGFLNYFTQMFIISRRCVACKTRLICSKVKVTLRASVHFCVRALTLSCMHGFLNYFTQMLTISRRYVTCRTRVKVKVTLRGLHFGGISNCLVTVLVCSNEAV